MAIKQNLTKPTDLKKIVDYRKLENIVIATGKKNQFIPDENKFVVTKEFLKDVTHLLSWCFSLKSVDFTNFDFSEITTMNQWFIGCNNLTEIVFPEEVDCPNLQSLSNCFTYTAIKSLNFKEWYFLKEVNLEQMCKACHYLEDLKLPKVNSLSSNNIACDCENLQTVECPLTFMDNEQEWLHNNMFENCSNLICLNCSNAKIQNKNLNIKNILRKNLKNTHKDLVVILPDKI